MATFTFVVQVEAESAEVAGQIMSERLSHDEEYDFTGDYTIGSFENIQNHLWFDNTGGYGGAADLTFIHPDSIPEEEMEELESAGVIPPSVWS